MKRHPALIPLSHDHHHGLVQARRLRRAAAGETAERRDAASAFLAFFDHDTRRHFREEEEGLFPLLVGAEDPATELLARALLEHRQIHSLVTQLTSGDASETTMRRLADALEEHIRFEERTLFPLVENVVSEEALRRLEDASAATEPVDLLSREGTGPLWGTETEDLNATLLAWPPGAGPPEHVNTARDVLLVVLTGSATVTVDNEERPIRAGEAMIVEKGRARRISAGPEGVRYLAVHQRRSPLQIASAPAAG